MWNKIKNLFGKKSDSEPVHNDKYIKTKINSCNKNFHGNKIPIEDKHCTCFSVILLDSIVNAYKKISSTNILTRMQTCNGKRKR